MPAKITLRPAIPSDAPSLAAINIKSFANSPFIANAFPNIPYDVVRPLKERRYLQKMSHPLTHVIVAVDEESGEVIGCSRWVIPTAEGKSAKELLQEETEKEKGKGAGAAAEIPEGTNHEVYEGFFGILKDKADVHLGGEDIVLEFLATHPARQGQGVGKALLAWGISQADKLQKRIYLEGTTEGYPLYAKSGWATLEKISIDYTRWGGEGAQELTLMMRDPLPYSSA
ncbi:acyl-CoA N-acyltransferase [Aspergillus karnatakaensis]|uniref:GNAT family N-acetyltransferase n=1 Tax=Aspergillus karnatakaensis TaxID=1810916 RepID=UPI003CCC9A40